jgi:hypothetical protein
LRLFTHQSRLRRGNLFLALLFVEDARSGETSKPGSIPAYSCVAAGAAARCRRNWASGPGDAGQPALIYTWPSTAFSSSTTKI